MATFLNYHRAARLSNDVGFRASCSEAFQMMGVQFSGLLFERTLSGQQDRHSFPLTAQSACVCRESLMGSMCIWTYRIIWKIPVRFCDSIWKTASWLPVSVLMESISTCGPLLLFKLFLKDHCFQQIWTIAKWIINKNENFIFQT